ncbi:MAG TPA: vWA domain-containing protein [Polyangiaceae bacterium]
MNHPLCPLVWLTLSTLAWGCAQQSDGQDNQGAVGGSASVDVNGNAQNGGNGNMIGGNDFGFIRSESGACRLAVNDVPCSAAMYETENIPLDIYVMFDRSGSMCSCVDPPLNGNPCPDPNCRKTRIEAIREAMASFVADTASNGLGVGVGYFGQQTIGAADCRPETYMTPDVAIAALPDNASNVVTSLNNAAPIGETPTGAAITGACHYARQWKSAHPEREIVILFVTDGEPKAPVSCPNGAGSCCPTLDEATTAASDCLAGEVGIRTYVLGVGPYLQNLTQIAQAGGTAKAYLVEGGDVAAQVLSALNTIRGDAAIPCEFRLPDSEPGQTLDLNKVNIAYTNTSCDGKVFMHVQAQTACTKDGGWYWDNPNQPTAAKLCPTSCNQVSQPGGALGFAIGCQTASPLL